MKNVFIKKMFGSRLYPGLAAIMIVSLLIASCGGGGANSGDSPATTYSISGQVSSGGSGLSGVTMTLSGSGSATTTTNASGNYLFIGLVNGSYIVTPSKTGLAFTPINSQRTVSNANITAVDFSASSTQGAAAQVVACPASGTTNVPIQNFAFTPSVITIGVNGVVKWTNGDAVAHTVTSGIAPNGDSRFDSGNLGAGSAVCVQFLSAGSYPYFCAIHTFMTGNVTVQ